MVFVDTGAIVAYFDADDPFHAAACEGFARLERLEEGAFSSNLCVAEAVIVLARGLDDFGRAARAGLDIVGWDMELVRPTPAEERRALLLMESYAEKRVGLVDCVSFAVMDSRGARKAFTFDHEHFVKLRKLTPWVPIPKL
jgi:predicted nucleic acid-binding protein